MKQSRERGGESTGGMLPVYQGHDAVSFFFFLQPGAFTSETAVHGNQHLQFSTETHAGLAPKHCFWETC